MLTPFGNLIKMFFGRHSFVTLQMSWYEHNMTLLSIRGVTKSYTRDVVILNKISLDVESGEFFTLLGPSGCGKTTLLRMIAGFLRQDSGEIVVGGQRIDHLPPHRRDVGLVFQDYAIFPHLTVAENVAFGLKARRLPKAEIEARVKDGLQTVRLSGFADRLPSALSGGQQQRVGLARAMAIRPQLLLMDEPLSNLDAKLRIELREDIREIQQRLGITTIYVTHDQEEALAVSDRICVMNGGRIEQVATPFEVYRHPTSRFAAAFVGTMNFLPATLEAGGVLHLGAHSITLPGRPQPGPVEIAVRPEDVVLGTDRASALVLEGAVSKLVYLGREAQQTLATDAGNIVMQIARPSPDALNAAGRHVSVQLGLDRIALFRPDGTRVAIAP
jgi:ABC-type Fe3+/spermidine/putrescine transport system ATPase subunit